MAVERVIHIAMFFLFLIGLGGVSAWANYAYVPYDFLKIAGTALSWGLILLVLYVGFKAVDWDWWS